jgi:signal peptidase I
MKPWVGAMLVLLAVAAALWTARRYLLVVRVDGTSMIPTFRPGEAVLALRRGRGERPRRGQIVVCRLPVEVPGPPGLLIKRVGAVAGESVPDGGDRVPDGFVYLLGDGPRSYDSRNFGPLPVGTLVGRVIARLSLRSV